MSFVERLASPFGQTLLFGFIAMAMTFVFAKPFGVHVTMKDCLFVIIVMITVFVYRKRKEYYLGKAGYETEGLDASPFENVVAVYPDKDKDYLEWEIGSVNAVLFFVGETAAEGEVFNRML